MKVAITGRDRALTPFDWVDIPAFALLIGLNGSGKSQLLAAIARSIKEPKGVATVSGLDASASQVVHQTSEWKVARPGPVGFAPAQVVQNVVQMYGMRKQSAPALAARIVELEKEKGVQPWGLSKDDLLRGLSATSVFEGKPYLATEISELFAEFGRRQADARLAGHPSPEGPPPWIVLDEILAAAQLPYAVVPPDFNSLTSQYQFVLRHTQLNVPIDLQHLSSGEQVIVSTLFWLFGTRVGGGLPKLLLLDEPDAHLHPQMTRQLLEVIHGVFVGEHKIRVIMTTHSPTTVALSPDDSLFLLESPLSSSAGRVRKVNKDAAIGMLTVGVPSLRVGIGNQRQIVVESEYDAETLQAVYTSLSQEFLPEVSLCFIPAGRGSNPSGGCDRVQRIVADFREGGVDTVFGLVDWDGEAVSTDYVKVLGGGERYAIENFVLDPIALGMFCWKMHLLSPAQLGVSPAARYAEAGALTVEDLQRVADAVVGLLHEKLRPLPDAGATQTVRLVGGMEVTVPRWFLKLQGHRLEDLVKEVIPGTRRYGTRMNSLHLAIIAHVFGDTPKLIPMSLFETLRQLQGSDA